MKESSTALRLYLLGSFRVENEKGLIDFSARKAQSLLAYLALHLGEHPREKLASLFWGDSTDAQARDSLRSALKTLRKPLGEDLFLSDRESVQLNPGLTIWVDALEFQRVADAKPPTVNLSAAVELYRGDLLADFYDEWIIPERERLRELYVKMLLESAQAVRARGQFAQAIEWAKKVLAVDSANEQAHRDLMFSYFSLGDKAAAVKQYGEAVRILRAELDLEPSPETTALYREIKQAAIEIPADDTRLSNIPNPLTSFVGRNREMEQIKGLMEAHRLVTLTGAGGSGKTRLAIQVAKDLVRAKDEPARPFKDGLWWIGLEALSDSTLVPAAIARVLGVREMADQPFSETLGKFLGSKRVLLILDNCEHLIDACARLAAYLLNQCPNLGILATSREGLNLAGESIFQVPTLSLPATWLVPADQILEHEATRLFVERARAAKSDLALDEPNALAIGQICRRLDGIPLAIELAAARVKVLSPEEIAAHVGDRFALLSSGSRTALPRHQTLRATIDWSHNLLTEPERILFRRLAVFTGGSTFETAKAVCPGDGIQPIEVLDLMSRLVDKSLVIAAAQQGEMRYRMLETIREYAGEKLAEAGEANTVRDRHLEFFLKLVEQVEPKLERAGQAIWLDRLDAEVDNLRAAIDWAVESRQSLGALRLVGGLRRLWFVRQHHYAGIERLNAILSRTISEGDIVNFAALTADFFMYWHWGQVIQVQPLIEEALALSRALGDRWNTAFAVLWLGVSLTAGGDYAQAQSYLEQSLELWRDLKDSTYVAWSYFFLGEVALFQNDLARATEFFEASVPPLREAADYPMLAMPLRRLGQLALREGDLQKAKALIHESLDYNWRIRDYRGVCACLAALAALRMAQGETEDAARLFGVVDRLLEIVQRGLLTLDQQQYLRNLDALRDRLDAPRFAKAWEEGRALALDQAVEYALEEGKSLEN